MTRCRLVRLLLVCGVLLTSVTAGAQEPQKDRRFGLTIGYPSAGGLIGLVWETSDRLAFRPEFSFSTRFAGEPTRNDSWSFGATLTVLRYVGRKDGVSAYVGPRFSYARSMVSGGSSDSTSSSYGVGGTAGLQYALTRRISVYGEVGLGYTFAQSTYGGALQNSAHTVSSRSSLGLNLYF